MKFTVEQIAQALINNDSMEVEGSKARYFLHITDAGEILPTLAGADETFTAETDAPDEDGDWREDFETLDNADFRTICEDLCRQANDYLGTWGEEEQKLFYAVIGNEQDPDFGYDCGDGSEDLDEAIKMAEEHEGGAFIAVMDAADGECVGEIIYNDFTGKWERK